MNEEFKVVGYVIGGLTDNKNIHSELLLAVFEDDSILCSYEKYTHSFNDKNREWVEIPFLPNQAEFIGNYKMKKMEVTK